MNNIKQTYMTIYKPKQKRQRKNSTKRTKMPKTMPKERPKRSKNQMHQNPKVVGRLPGIPPFPVKRPHPVQVPIPGTKSPIAQSGTIQKMCPGFVKGIIMMTTQRMEKDGFSALHVSYGSMKPVQECMESHSMTSSAMIVPDNLASLIRINFTYQ